MLHLLTDSDKENHLEICQELLAKANCHGNYLKKILTGNEAWVYGFGVEKRYAAFAVGGKGLLEQKKKAQMSWSEIEVVLAVF